MYIHIRAGARPGPGPGTVLHRGTFNPTVEYDPSTRPQTGPIGIYIGNKYGKIHIWPYRSIYGYICLYMAIYMTIYGYILYLGCLDLYLGVWTCILGVWTCI